MLYRLPEIIIAITSGLLKGVGSIIDVGVQLIRGLFEGIKNAGTWLYNKLRGWVSNVLGWVKGLFGIHSPSTVFADEIGKFIPPGITVGVEKAMPRALRDMGQELSALSNIPIPAALPTPHTWAASTLPFTAPRARM